MNEFETSVLQTLQEIKELLEPISSQHKEAFLHDKLNLLRGVITPKNAQAFRLLFDPRSLTQQQIAREADVSQPTVSRLVKELLEKRLIEEKKNSNLNVAYVDKWNLQNLLDQVQ